MRLISKSQWSREAGISRQRVHQRVQSPADELETFKIDGQDTGKIDADQFPPKHGGAGGRPKIRKIKNN